MKKIISIIVFLFLSASLYSQGKVIGKQVNTPFVQERISDTKDGVTVYTNNGAVIKAKNTKSNRQCEYTCTIQYKDKNTGKIVEVEETHSFSIDKDEERTLLQPGGTITKIKINSVKEL